MYEKVRHLLAEKFEVDESKLSRETRIKEDLKADSLDIVELIMDLEDNFDLTISDEEAMKLSTIGDIVAYIESHQ